VVGAAVALPAVAAAAATGGFAVRAVFTALLVAGLLGVLLAARRLRRPGTPRKTFLGHVEELRRRLVVVLGASLAGTLVAFSFRIEAWRGFWRPVPAVQDNLAAQLFRSVRDDLVPAEVRLVATSPLDGIMAEFTVALLLGVVVALPLALAQAARFLGPALQENERRAVRWALLPALALFAAGAAFGYTAVLPFLFGTLYSYSDALGAELLLQVPDFVSFTFGLLLVLGLAFQTPLVMAVLSRFGVVRARTWLRSWRYALVAILIASAVVTDPTVISQLLVAAPLTVLYFLGVAAAALLEKRSVRPGAR